MSKSKTAIKITAQEIVGLVDNFNLEEADRNITDFADVYGDKMVPSLLKSLPPSVVGILVSEVATKPSSIIGNLIDPQTFASSFEELPKKWSKENSALATRDIEAVMLGIVMQTEDECTYPRAKELYKALANKHDGEILAWWLWKYLPDVVSFAKNHKWQTVTKKDSFVLLTELTGDLEFEEELSMEEIPEDEDFKNDSSSQIYYPCPDEIRKCVELMPPDLLAKVVKIWSSWRKINENEAYCRILPRVVVTTQSAL